MQNQFTIRLGTASDLEQLYEIYMDEHINPFLNFEIMSKSEFLPIFHDLLNSGNLYVYETSNQIISTCIVMRQKRRAHHVASLGTLATHPQWQRQGIDHQFMRELFDKLKSEGVKRIDLCSEEDNIIAHKFYKKLGFKHEGTLKKYFKRPYEGNYLDEYMFTLIYD